MNLFRTFWICALYAAHLSAYAQEGVMIERETIVKNDKDSHEPKEFEVRTYIKNNKLRIDQGDDSSVLLAPDRPVVILDHENQIFLEFKKPDIEKLNKQLTSVVDSLTEPVRVGGSEVVLGFETQQYEWRLGGTRFTVWVAAPEAALDGSRQVSYFMQKHFSDSVGLMRITGIQNHPQIPSGVILKSLSQNAHHKVTRDFVSFKEISVSDAQFEVPKTYVQRPLPDFMLK